MRSPSEMRRRLLAVAVVAVLAALTLAAPAGGQSPASAIDRPTDVEIARALEKVKADPNLATDRTIRTLHWKDSQVAARQTRWPAWLLWLGEFFRWVNQSARVLMWIALIGLAASTYYHFARQNGGPTSSSQYKDGTIANAINVNLRSEPSSNSGVLVTMPAGTRVRVLEYRGAWVRVKVLKWAGATPDNAPDDGWVGSHFVQLD